MTTARGPRSRHRVLTWVWRAWAATPILVLLGSLGIGYLRSSGAPELRATRDSLEVLVALGFSALVCLPLVLGAYYLEARSHSSADHSWHWLTWLLLALLFPLGFWMFFTYLFGTLGMSIRSWTSSIFGPA
ncbi:MAG TPA: hypothetical protein VJV79_08755 [Polyangiaceae bacterium]|nr:hypothetical protein [Polyangiaceae bacterium]